MILFFVLDWVFLQVRFQICCYLLGLRGPGAVNLNMSNQWYTQIIYLWCLFNDFFNYFVVVVFLFWCFKGLTGCLYESRYIVQGIYRLTDTTFSMHLYERTEVISQFSWDFIWALFFHKQQDKKTMKYTKNVLHEGLKLKNLILFAAIYQIGDAACLLVLENIVLVLQMVK